MGLDRDVRLADFQGSIDRDVAAYFKYDSSSLRSLEACGAHLEVVGADGYVGEEVDTGLVRLRGAFHLRGRVDQDDGGVGDQSSGDVHDCALNVAGPRDLRTSPTSGQDEQH